MKKVSTKNSFVTKNVEFIWVHFHPSRIISENLERKRRRSLPYFPPFSSSTMSSPNTSSPLPPPGADPTVDPLEVKREAIRKAVAEAKQKNSLPPVKPPIATKGPISTTINSTINNNQQNSNNRSSSSGEHSSRDGRTPLHVAAANGHLDVVKLLVSYGADMNARS